MVRKTYDTDDVVAGFDLGVVDDIGKPPRMAEVRARVRARLMVNPNSETRGEPEQRLRIIVVNMAEGLMIVETTGRIQYTNPACDTYLGYDAGKLAGHSISKLLPAPLAQHYRAWFDRCAADPDGAARRARTRVKCRSTAATARPRAWI